MKNDLRLIALALPLVVLGGACASQSRTGAMSETERASSPGGTRPAPQASTQEPMMRPGPAVAGHAGDQVVNGRIASAQPGSISISTEGGDLRTLQIVPETSVQLDGKDASTAELHEGLPVRASFDRVDGQNVAVKVWAGEQLPASPGGDDFSVPGHPGRNQ